MPVQNGFEVSTYKNIPLKVSEFPNIYVKRWKWLPKWFLWNKIKIEVKYIAEIYLINTIKIKELFENV